MTGQEAICYQWFKQRLIFLGTSHLQHSTFLHAVPEKPHKPSISQRSQIKEDTVEPSVPAREFNLEAYAAITYDSASLGLKPRCQVHEFARVWAIIRYGLPTSLIHAYA